MNNRFNISVESEIGELEGVIIHTPGPEIENMTPENAERALYSDILNLSVASEEYTQFSGVLNKLTRTFQVKDLLLDIISNEKVKIDLINKICSHENIPHLYDYLRRLGNVELTTALIEGVIMHKDTLSTFLNKERYSLRPLHNFFFTRDASISWNSDILIGKMASKIRDRESIIMEAIFQYSLQLNTKTINPRESKDYDPKITIEGGDVLIAREDVMLIGIGARTTSEGVDFILNKLKRNKEVKHVIVQELPKSPESFIHLDMVFTFLDVDKCMVYEPVIMKPNRLQSVHITIDNGKVKFQEVENIVEALQSLNIDLKPISCGGQNDEWIQEREQWHSGANFFAVGPGKVIGYSRNVNTIEELNKNGFEVIKALDLVNGNASVENVSKYVITIDGSELSRGGGGARCMSMPIRRKAVDW